MGLTQDVKINRKGIISCGKCGSIRIEAIVDHRYDDCDFFINRCKKCGTILYDGVT